MYTRTIQRLSLCLLGLVAVSCVLSIIYNNVYNDSEWVRAQWLGQDVVTLLLAVPLLGIARSRHQRDYVWRIVLAGVFFYFIYTYAFFLFAAELSWFYLAHAPIFSMAAIGFFLSLAGLMLEKRMFSQTPIWLKRSIIGYILFITLMVGALWLSQIFAHLTDPGYRSNMPDGKPPMIIYSLDLAIVLPLMVVAAVGYWKKKFYGYVLTGVMLVKTSTLGIALMSMGLSMYLLDQSPEYYLVILWCVIGLIGGFLTILYLRHTVTGSE